MSEILLLNPPAVDSISYGRINNEDSWSPPLGIAGIAAVLERNGFDVKAYDLYYESWEKSEHIIREEESRIIGISCFSDQRASTFRLIEFIRSLKSDVQIVLGGPHPTSMYQQMLLHLPIDAVVIGEGEATFLEYVQAYFSGRPLMEVTGLALRVDGKVMTIGHRDRIRDLDSLPCPTYHHFGKARYAGRDWLCGLTCHGRPAQELRWTSLVGSRGCPFNCTFCTTPSTWGRGLRRRSPRNLVGEIQWLHEHYGYEFFNFEDDIFSTDQRWVIEICKEILACGLKIGWNSTTRFDCISEEMLGWMKRAGCVFISYGIESFANENLDALNKRSSKEKNLRACLMTHEAGIETELLLIVGSPTETDDTIEETAAIIEEINPFYVDPSILTIFPGTQLYHQAKFDGFIDDDYWLTSAPPPYDTRIHNLDKLKQWYYYIKALDRRKLNRATAGKRDLNSPSLYSSILLKGSERIP